MKHVESRSRSDQQTIAKQLAESVEKAEHEAKVQAAYLEDLRQQILALKQYQTAVDKKVGVALRFVDWFADVKLKGNPAAIM